MQNVIGKIQQTDWQRISKELNDKGFAYVPSILTKPQCAEIISSYGDSNRYRKTVVMERYRFGLGEYKYFDYPLPNIIQIMRKHIYPKLVPVVNLWMNQLKIEKNFPCDLQNLLEECHVNGQSKPTPLILKYGKGGFNTLHQDLYGEVYFPLQVAFFLNEPELDYSGGEFVLTQQIPRAQSKVTVLKPQQGSMLIFTTNFRPIKGVRAYYRASMRHGVSEVISGNRHTLGIIFHDAVS